MEKHPNPFDDFLKEALKDHQLAPREKARKAFLEEASAIVTARKGWNNWYYLPVLVVLISGIITVIYYFNHDDSTPSILLQTENPSSLFISDSSEATSTSLLTPVTKSNPVISDVNTPTETPISQPADKLVAQAGQGYKDKSVNEDAIGLNKIVEENPALAGFESEKPVQQAYAGQNIPTANDTLYSITTLSGLDLDSLSSAYDNASEPANAATSPESDTSGLKQTPLPLNTPQPEHEKPAAYYTVAVVYLPELMFNTLEGSKFVNNFGMEGTFYRGKTSIRTGLGLSISQGITENAVQYNEYLGTYNKLDSITFTFNELAHDFSPNLHMSKEKVWDSNPDLDSTKVTKRYTYLQVPLVLGFDFWQQGRLTIGVRIGTIMSVLLSSRQLTGEYDAGENQVTGINSISPEHVRVNWQAIGGFNASVNLSKAFFFEFEPQAKYYYQSIYEKSDLTKKPWSVGVRLGVTYKF